MQKMNFIFETVFEILEFIKFCNLTGLEHFYFQLQNQTRDFQIHNYVASFKPKETH